MNRSIVSLRRITQYSRSKRLFSSQQAGENEPIKFTASPASRKVVNPVLRRVKQNDMPWYQPYSVLGSVSAMLIYFCILREENDIDLEFTKTLYERIQGLEKHQLIQVYKVYKEEGKDVTDIERRLQELDLEIQKSA